MTSDSRTVDFVEPQDLVDAERYGRRGYPHDVWTRLRAEAPFVPQGPCDGTSPSPGGGSRAGGPAFSPCRRLTSGAIMTERMRQSAMLWLRSKRLSALASSLSKPSPVSRQRLTILRLKRAVDSSLGRRVLTTLGTSLSLPSSIALTSGSPR